MEALLIQIVAEISEFAGDGEYDKRKTCDNLYTHSLDVSNSNPPGKNAGTWILGNTKKGRLKRDENLCSIRKHACNEWIKKSGYHVHTLWILPFTRIMHQSPSSDAFPPNLPVSRLIH